MKKSPLSNPLLLSLALGVSLTACTTTHTTQTKSQATPKTGEFALQVLGLQNGHFQDKHLLSENYGFGCTGGNISPALAWTNAPVGTKSFVVTLYDKDAPTGLGWVHWVVANIPVNVSQLPEGVRADGQNLPQNALQTRTDFGVAGFGGACPPKDSTHRYEISVTALSVDKLPNITTDATPALVGYFTQKYALGQAKVTLVEGR